MRWLKFLLLLIAMLIPVTLMYPVTLMWFKKPERWAVYYSQMSPAEAFLPYDVLVFDRDGHPPLPTLDDGKRLLLGYVSFGEAEIHRKDYPQVQALDVLIDGVPGWQGNAFIDVRKPQWRDYILNTIIPDLMREGFNGVMLDTVDNLIWLEDKDPVAYAGIRRATIDLIHAIHQSFPQLHIMLNRGFSILPHVAADIHMLLAESVYTSWNTATATPAMAPPDIQQNYLRDIQKAQKQFPGLKVYSLDYWPPDAIEAIRAIYKQQRANGFIPYVTTPDLQTLHPEPGKE